MRQVVMRTGRAALAALALIFTFGGAGYSSAAEDPVEERLEALEKAVADQRYAFDQILKRIDDVLWFERVGDVAEVDKVYLTGPPDPNAKETYGIVNERQPFKFWTYVFTPRDAPSPKAPLLVLPHGGVRSDFTTYHTHIVRELIEQGYVVVAPEYRGSTGYGQSYEEGIDYGGLEVDDCVAARDWAVENLPQVDGSRVGILGWSHGGMIALHAVFDHPDKFRVAYAGVPVSDLLARMGYQTDRYRRLFAAKHHIGKPANEAVEEYRRRSPAWNAAKLRTPLLIHTTTNDRDVNVIEVEHLIAQLKAAGKKFEYRIYEDFPAGHSLNRIDTREARESRREVWSFLAKHLK